MEQLVAQRNIDNCKIDLLDRQPFVEQMINIIEKLSSQNKNACYAINGKWGVGKTFVLEMLENQIKEIQQEGDITDKYLLFHYDCWKYDYYEEPIIAIVASMMDEIDKNVNLLPADKAETVKSILKAVGSSLLLNANDKIKELINVDIKEIVDIIKNGLEDADKKLQNNHQYDTYFAFKQVLSCFQETIKSLADNQTVIMVVDELDRCLPEYMIKVLERLHHIFNGIPNVQVILSMDKDQINHTVQQIYGKNTDVNKYLAKFISFEVNLEIGNLNDEYEKVYSYYFSKFECLNGAITFCDIQDFQKNIMSGIDMRSKIEIINKCNLLHDMLCAENKSDYSIMCIEMFLAILKYWNVDIETSYHLFSRDKLFQYEKDKKIYTGLDYLHTRYNQEESGGLKLYAADEKRVWVRRNNIWSLLFTCYRYILGFTRDIIDYDSYKGKGIRNYCTEYWNFLHVVK